MAGIISMVPGIAKQLLEQLNNFSGNLLASNFLFFISKPTPCYSRSFQLLAAENLSDVSDECFEDMIQFISSLQEVNVPT
ncbi:hypothetical protein NPIL_479691 [Nephila pilipes]|uniref:Uncharacterized protein n=1 Tax=Nephila pilipes TaxID=299642 RepID=A0A8X6P8I0_NEPPI|nr:hypothetical protein NPIL_479691 [Nephila pilipes]